LQVSPTGVHTARSPTRNKLLSDWNFIVFSTRASIVCVALGDWPVSAN
jgi:hypothetical protein